MASPLSILKTVLNLTHNRMHVTNCETAFNCKTKFHPEHPFRGIYFFQIRGWSLVLQMFMMDIWLFPLWQNRSKHE